MAVIFGVPMDAHNVTLGVQDMVLDSISCFRESHGYFLPTYNISRAALVYESICSLVIIVLLTDNLLSNTGSVRYKQKYRSSVFQSNR